MDVAVVMVRSDAESNRAAAETDRSSVR